MLLPDEDGVACCSTTAGEARKLVLPTAVHAENRSDWNEAENER